MKKRASSLPSRLRPTNESTLRRYVRSVLLENAGIKCKSCGEQNPADAKFCEECGKGLFADVKDDGYRDGPSRAVSEIDAQINELQTVITALTKRMNVAPAIRSPAEKEAFKRIIDPYLKKVDELQAKVSEITEQMSDNPSAYGPGNRPFAPDGPWRVAMAALKNQIKQIRPVTKQFFEELQSKGVDISKGGIKAMIDALNGDIGRLNSEKEWAKMNVGNEKRSADSKADHEKKMAAMNAEHEKKMTDATNKIAGGDERKKKAMDLIDNLGKKK